MEEYKYKPPIRYFFIGLLGILMSVLFGFAIAKDKIWFSAIMILFGLITLAMGIGFLTIFIRTFSIGNLVIGNDFIEVPGRWKKRTKFKLDEIIEIGEFNTYDNVIEIQSQYGIHLIEKNWMKKKDFEKLKVRLNEYWTNKNYPQ